MVLDVLMHSNTVKVSELSKKTNLSKTTLMKILKHFIEEGFVVKEGKGESTNEGGKKPNLYRFNTNAGFIFSIQIFPKEILSTITNLKSEILFINSEKIEKDENINIIIEKITKAFNDMVVNNNIDSKKLLGIGLASHGITNISTGTIITSPHFPSWGENLPLRDLLRKNFGDDIPIVIDNQIRFQALAEKNSENGKNKRNIIVIEGGEGLVAGIIVKNSIKRGIHYLAGEIGHMVINPEGEYMCACGGRGCFEALISVNRLKDIALKKFKDNKDSLVFKGKKSHEIDIFNIFSASNAGDRFARELMDDVVKWFAIGFSNIILMYDPEMIIIQGIYSKAGEYFINNLRKQINNVSLLKIRKDVEIEYSRFGKEVGVIGASDYVISEFFN